MKLGWFTVYSAFAFFLSCIDFGANKPPSNCFCKKSWGVSCILLHILLALLYMGVYSVLTNAGETLAVFFYVIFHTFKRHCFSQLQIKTEKCAFFQSDNKMCLSCTCLLCTQRQYHVDLWNQLYNFWFFWLDPFQCQDSFSRFFFFLVWCISFLRSSLPSYIKCVLCFLAMKETVLFQLCAFAAILALLQ